MSSTNPLNLPTLPRPTDLLNLANPAFPSNSSNSSNPSTPSNNQPPLPFPLPAPNPNLSTPLNILNPLNPPLPSNPANPPNPNISLTLPPPIPNARYTSDKQGFVSGPKAPLPPLIDPGDGRPAVYLSEPWAPAPVGELGFSIPK
ncbi:hypothetical protein VTL71DRAFT_9558 [Oculimacula yallundae]|uniref:Uncharacterized protein n=1 Tax=Oculimacula yallundae TaxID=86028 RepID=A0ABR4BR47_9HELO